MKQYWLLTCDGSSWKFSTKQPIQLAMKGWLAVEDGAGRLAHVSADHVVAWFAAS